MPKATSNSTTPKPDYDPEKQYLIRIGRPIIIDADTVLLPSHEEILVIGSLLEQIKDQVLEANECA